MALGVVGGHVMTMHDASVAASMCAATVGPVMNIFMYDVANVSPSCPAPPPAPHQ